MTDTAVPCFADTQMRCKNFAARIGCLFYRALEARKTRRALNELPHDLLRDMGLNRADIDFVADALASGRRDPTRDPQDQFNRSVTLRQAMPCQIPDRNVTAPAMIETIEAA